MTSRGCAGTEPVLVLPQDAPFACGTCIESAERSRKAVTKVSHRWLDGPIKLMCVHINVMNGGQLPVRLFSFGQVPSERAVRSPASKRAGDLSVGKSRERRAAPVARNLLRERREVRKAGSARRIRSCGKQVQ